MVTWDPPSFIDNSGDNIEVTGSHDNGTEFATNNVANHLWYRAVDASGNRAYCNFTVVMKRKTQELVIYFTYSFARDKIKWENEASCYYPGVHMLIRGSTMFRSGIS